MLRRLLSAILLTFATVAGIPQAATAQRTQKPPLHGRHWMAVTGKPLAAAAGAMTFAKGGNAIDAACAMLARTATRIGVLWARGMMRQARGPWRIPRGAPGAPGAPGARPSQRQRGH